MDAARLAGLCRWRVGVAKTVVVGVMLFHRSASGPRVKQRWLCEDVEHASALLARRNGLVEGLQVRNKMTVKLSSY